MGWCSGTDIFDSVVCAVLKMSIPIPDQKKIIHVLMDAMQDKDWDCQSDSMYYDHPFVREAYFDLLHPDWKEGYTNWQDYFNQEV